MTTTAENAILEALDSSIEEIRHKATKKLPEVFDKVPVDILFKALGDESWRVRKAAVEVAAEYSFDDQLLKLLLQGLSSQDNAGLRSSASEVLVKAGKKAMGAVVQLLEHADRDIRKFAADILGDMGLTESVPFLTRSLSDEDENVRGAVAEALGAIGDPSCVPDLLASLNDDGLLVKLSSLDSLNKLGAHVPFEVLQSLLQIRPLRPLVYRLMSGLHDPGDMKKAAEILVVGLDSKAKADLAAASWSLSRLVKRMDKDMQVGVEVSVAKSASDRLCGALERLLDSDDREQKAAAVTLLGWTGRTQAVESLLRAAADERLSEQVFAALDAIGPKGAARLEELLDDLGRAEKVLALQMLGRYRKKSTLPSVVQKCLDEDQEVAHAAQYALGQMGDAFVIPSLVEILRSDGKACKGAVGALSILGARYHDEVMKSLKEVMESGFAGARRYAAEAICGVASKLDQAMLEELTQDHDPAVRAHATSALGRVGEDGVVEKIRMMLADESEIVRIASARALGLQKSHDAVDGLVLLFKDEHPKVIIEALRALEKLGYNDAVEMIVPLLSSEDVLVALTAAHTLGVLGWDGDSKLLDGLRKSADPEVLKELLGNSQKWLKSKRCDLIAAAIEHSRWDVRMAAVKAISICRDEDCFSMLSNHIEKESDDLVKEEIHRVLKLVPDVD